MTPSTKGKKHLCVNCEARYFDLGHLPAKCPKCGTVAKEVKPKDSSSKSPKKSSKPNPIIESAPSLETSKNETTDELDAIEIADDGDDDTDDSLIEDTSDLENDDLPDVIKLDTDRTTA